jgi:hypothetical protein
MREEAAIKGFTDKVTSHIENNPAVPYTGDLSSWYNTTQNVERE